MSFNIMGGLSGMSGMSNMGGLANMGGLSNMSGLNAMGGLSLNIGMQIPMNITDSLNLSGIQNENSGQASISNLMSQLSPSLGFSSGMGMVPGFGGACNQSSSMFGGMIQLLQQQQTMMMMQMMQQMMQMMQSGGFGGSNGSNGMQAINGGSNGTGGTNATGAAGSVSNLQGDDAKKSKFIDSYLQQKSSPMAGKGAGDMMVRYAKQYNMDPLILLAIARQETNMGKTGIGINGCLGVGAYDSNPTNALTNPQFAGMENQLRVGAKTFDNLRNKGGSNSNASVAEQISAAGKKWATDPKWAQGVTSIYNQIAQEFQSFQG